MGNEKETLNCILDPEKHQWWSQTVFFKSIINLCSGRAFSSFLIFYKKAQDPQMGLSILLLSPQVCSL